MSAGELTRPWSIANFNLEELIQDFAQLKEGSIEERIRYILSMQVLEEIGIVGDPYLRQTLKDC